MLLVLTSLLLAACSTGTSMPATLVATDLKLEKRWAA